MITNRHLRRMTKVELVQYGLEGDRPQRRAADELFRRYYEKFKERGLLKRSEELADAEPDEADSMPPPDNVRSIL